jgi:AraC family transcriptional regulator
MLDLNHLEQSASFARRHGLLTDKHPASDQIRFRSVGAFEGVFVDTVQPAGNYRDPPADELLMLVLKSQIGSSKFSYENDRKRFNGTVASQNFYVQSPGTYCRFDLDRPLRFVALSVPNQHVTSIQETSGLPSIRDYSALHHVVFEDLFLQQSLLRLFDWSSPCKQGTHMLARESMLIAMIVRLTELASTATLPVLNRNTGLQRWQVLRVLDRLQGDLSVSPSLQELATLVDMSQFHFCRAFKKTLGHSPIQYLISLRMERATELLRQTSMSISDVAMKIGYEDPSYFTRLYRAKVGVTPNTVRQCKN